MTIKYNTDDIKPEEFLAALYNARPLGMGFLAYNPNPMSLEEAKEEIKKTCTREADKYCYFDYVNGKPIKTFFSLELTDNNFSFKKNTVIDLSSYHEDQPHVNLDNLYNNLKNNNIEPANNKPARPSREDEYLIFFSKMLGELGKIATDLTSPKKVLPASLALYDINKKCSDSSYNIKYGPSLKQLEELDINVWEWNDPKAVSKFCQIVGRINEITNDEL